jgi:DNA-binding NarL/FixJ family response regulator
MAGFRTHSRCEIAIMRRMNRSVLIVDDDPQFRGLTARLLAADGLAVIGEAASIDEALSAADRLKPSGILIDAGLPDGDGMALAKQLAALPWRPRIVLISIDEDIATADNARRAGAEAFLKKVELADAPLAQLFGGD